jgi:putative SOS response-associated peptidase YedK
MCGRFARKSTQEVLAEWLGLDLEEMPWFAPTYNAALLRHGGLFQVFNGGLHACTSVVLASSWS